MHVHLHVHMRIAAQTCAYTYIFVVIHHSSLLSLFFSPCVAQAKRDAIEREERLNSNTKKLPSILDSVKPLAHQSSVWTHDESQFVPANERLANFYRKYNKIMLDNVAISKEKERLELENAQLQDLIAQYVSGTTLDQSTLAEDNPLFVVNGRTALNHAPPVRHKKIVSQDAGSIIAASTRQMIPMQR